MRFEYWEPRVGQAHVFQPKPISKQILLLRIQISKLLQICIYTQNSKLQSILQELRMLSSKVGSKRSVLSIFWGEVVKKVLFTYDECICAFAGHFLTLQSFHKCHRRERLRWCALLLCVSQQKSAVPHGHKRCKWLTSLWCGDQLYQWVLSWSLSAHQGFPI